MKSLIILLSITFYSVAVFAEDGYAPFDPSKIESIDGKTLLIVSYGIVIGLLSLYWGSVAIQTKKTSAQISVLERELEQ